MKIIKLEIANLLKLRCVSITPQGNVITITGENGAGKSSVLNAIFYALAGTKDIASHPVRVGEDKAHIKLDLGEIIVTRRFTSDGQTSLVVESQSGARYPSPQRMLSDLIGALSFDPLAFTRMEPKKQLEVLRSLVKLEVDVDSLDALNKVDFDKRTEVNREVKRLESQLSTLQFPLDTPENAIDDSALLKRMGEAAEHNMAIEREARARVETEERIKRDRTEVVELRKRAEMLEQAAMGAEQLLASRPPLEGLTNLSDLKEEIESARKVNENVRVRLQHAKLSGEFKSAWEEAEALTLAMSQRLGEKEKAISGARMPVPNLSFGEGEVLYNGLPLAQASSAQQLLISTTLAIAMNPRLRVLRIQDGSLLDAGSLELIGRLAEKSDMQIWIERVESDDPMAVHLEEGRVVANANIS